MAMHQILGWAAGHICHAEPRQHRSQRGGGSCLLRQGGFQAVVQRAREALQFALGRRFLGLQQQPPHCEPGGIQQRAHHQQRQAGQAQPGTPQQPGCRRTVRGHVATLIPGAKRYPLLGTVSIGEGRPCAASLRRSSRTWAATTLLTGS